MNKTCKDCGEEHGELFEFTYKDLKAANDAFKLATAYVNKLYDKPNATINREETQELIVLMGDAVKHIPKLIQAIKVLVDKRSEVTRVEAPAHEGEIH